MTRKAREAALVVLALALAAGTPGSDPGGRPTVSRCGPAAAEAGGRTLSRRDRAAEALFTGLRRREGIRLAAFRTRYGIDPFVDW